MRLNNKEVRLVIFVAILGFIAVLGSFSTHVRAEAGPIEIGYLMDEDFSFLDYSVPGELKASGWDIEPLNGSLFNGYNAWFKISDTSTSLPVSMNKKIVSQSVGEITLEYRFKFVSVMDGMKWALRSNEDEGVSLITQNDILYLETAGDPVPLVTYEAGVEYGVKVVVDVTGKKTSVYVNGVLKASGVAFKQPVTSLNNFQMNTGGTAVGDVYIAAIKIYKGYAVNERFISIMPNSVPVDWVANAVNGVITVAEMKSSPYPDIFSLKMDATNSTSGMSFEKIINPSMRSWVFEYKVLIPINTNGLTAALRNGQNNVIKLTTSSGKLTYVIKDKVSGLDIVKSLYDYKDNLWYHIKVISNKVSSKPDIYKADIYINGKLQVTGVDLSTGNIDRIKFSTSSKNKGVMWLDDILLYKNLPLPSDYVPAPMQVSKASPDQPLVGAQTCNLWREGHHLGWDLINPYPERKPYLGFYDEGSPEVADWEIKWMVEHGIDFQLSCWYRPTGGEGQPIKDPYLPFALHNGFFNAQYSNRMKFAIMWANGISKVSSSSDFRNNLIPYWIEYYFKDPRYLVIDNKPVISLHNLEGLKENFGQDLSVVKAEIDYLRSAVKSAGFADVIILGTYSGLDPQVMRDEKAAGIDAVYAYSRGIYSGHAAWQQLNLKEQRDAGAIDVVPTISMGRDDTPWPKKSPRGSGGYYAPRDEFQSMAQWVKDAFIPSLQTNSVGQKMILLDNWNEFGEGHFIMPAVLDGFGYLDAIRNVFTTGGAHADIQPTQAQINRINTLYPSERVFPTQSLIPPVITDTYSKIWEFDELNHNYGWAPLYNIQSFSVGNGIISGTSASVDSSIISDDLLGINADGVAYLKIRMRNSTKDVEGQVYFITDTDTQFNEEKSVFFYVVPADVGYTDYYVNMWQNKHWTGTVKRLRVDPSKATGDFSIDYIKMVKR